MAYFKPLIPGSEKDRLKVQKILEDNYKKSLEKFNLENIALKV